MHCDAVAVDACPASSAAMSRRASLGLFDGIQNEQTLRNRRPNRLRRMSADDQLLGLHGARSLACDTPCCLLLSPHPHPHICARIRAHAYASGGRNGWRSPNRCNAVNPRTTWGRRDPQTNEELVASLSERGVLRSENITDAFLAVPRADFLPEDDRVRGAPHVLFLLLADGNVAPLRVCMPAARRWRRVNRGVAPFFAPHAEAGV